MKPSTAYRRLNSLLWLGRLPSAIIIFASNDYIPCVHAVTLHEDVFAKPIIILNGNDRLWGETLVHEALHIAEPKLQHGPLFDTIVKQYWRIAKKKIKGLK